MRHAHVEGEASGAPGQEEGKREFHLSLLPLVLINCKEGVMPQPSQAGSRTYDRRSQYSGRNKDFESESKTAV